MINSPLFNPFIDSHDWDFCLCITRIFCIFWTLESVPNRRDGCCFCSCCYRFRKMPKALFNTQRKVTKLSVHIREITPARSTVLDF